MKLEEAVEEEVIVKLNIDHVELDVVFITHNLV